MEEINFTESASVHPHTYLREKYVQEAEAEASYMPKFMHTKPKGFPEGRGPIDLQNVKHYNKKLENYIKKSILQCNNNPN